MKTYGIDERADNVCIATPIFKGEKKVLMMKRKKKLRNFSKRK